jgi:hypothetical protein
MRRQAEASMLDELLLFGSQTRDDETLKRRFARRRAVIGDGRRDHHVAA